VKHELNQYWSNTTWNNI